MSSSCEGQFQPHWCNNRHESGTDPVRDGAKTDRLQREQHVPESIDQTAVVFFRKMCTSAEEISTLSLGSGANI